MDLQLINKGLNFTKKKKKWVLILAAFGITSYGAYRVYNLPSIVRKRNRVLKLLSSLISIAEVFSNSAETIGILSKDLREFLQSDSDEIPNSLKQVSKLVKSEEFEGSVVRVTAALTRGVFRGYEVESRGAVDGGSESNSGFYDRFMDNLFSDEGSGFVSVVAGSFARNIVTALYSDELSKGGSNFDAMNNPWVDAMCSERGRDFLGECIQRFVSTAIAVYLDKTMMVNTYDELFAGLTNPKHEKPMREMLVALCNGSIETLVKTSHQVLTKSSSGSASASASASVSNDISQFVLTRSNSDIVSKTYYSEIDDACNVISVKQRGIGPSLALDEDENSSSGEDWVSKVSSTLAVPSNRKLVLDLTGKVTFETVRSFLEFLLEKFFASVKRSFGVANEAVIETGLGVLRYVSAKSSVVASICLSLCLHVLGGTWLLMPA